MARILRFVSSSFALAFTIASLVIAIILGYPQNLAKYGVSEFQALALVSPSSTNTAQCETVAR